MCVSALLADVKQRLQQRQDDNGDGGSGALTWEVAPSAAGAMVISALVSTSV
jgi:hypothetical protein